MGFTAGLKGFTAAVVGGIGSIPGAMLGGLLIGLTEAFATGYLPGGSVYAEPLRLRPADHHVPHSAERAAGQARDPEGVMPMGDGHAGESGMPAGVPDAVDGPQVGADEWVAQSRSAASRRPASPARSRASGTELPAAGASSFARPVRGLPVLRERGNLYRYGLITLIYALLALGLNVVVGFAGLLDLGYVAFFGFGAYLYGIIASGHSGHHLQAELAIPIVTVVDRAARPAPRAARRGGCSATTSRS